MVKQKPFMLDACNNVVRNQDTNEPPNSPAFPVEPKDRFDYDKRLEHGVLQAVSGAGSTIDASLPTKSQGLESPQGSELAGNDSHDSSSASAPSSLPALQVLVNDGRPVPERKANAKQEAAELLQREADDFLRLHTNTHDRRDYQASFGDNDSSSTARTTEREGRLTPPTLRARDFEAGDLDDTELSDACHCSDQLSNGYAGLRQRLFRDAFQGALSDGEFVNSIRFDKNKRKDMRPSGMSTTYSEPVNQQPVHTQGYGEYSLDVDGGSGDSEYIKQWMLANDGDVIPYSPGVSRSATPKPTNASLADITTEVIERRVARLLTEAKRLQREVEIRRQAHDNSMGNARSTSEALGLRGGAGSHESLEKLSTVANAGSDAGDDDILHVRVLSSQPGVESLGAPTTAQTSEIHAPSASIPPPAAVTQEQREEAANYYFEQASRQGYDHARLMSLEYLRGRKDHKIPVLLAHASLEQARRLQENEDALYARALHLEELMDQKERTDKLFTDPEVKKVLQKRVDESDEHDADDESDGISQAASITSKAKGKQPVRQFQRANSQPWLGPRLRKHREGIAQAEAALAGDSDATSPEQASSSRKPVFSVQEVRNDVLDQSPEGTEATDKHIDEELDSATYHKLLQAKQAEVDALRRELIHERVSNSPQSDMNSHTDTTSASKSQSTHSQISKSHDKPGMAKKQAGVSSTNEVRFAAHDQFNTGSPLARSLAEQASTEAIRQVGAENHLANYLGAREEDDRVSLGTMSERSSLDRDTSVGTSTDSDEYK